MERERKRGSRIGGGGKRYSNPEKRLRLKRKTNNKRRVGLGSV